MALYRPPYGMGGLSGLGSPMDPTGMLHHRLPAYPGNSSYGLKSLNSTRRSLLDRAKWIYKVLSRF